MGRPQYFEAKWVLLGENDILIGEYRGLVDIDTVAVDDFSSIWKTLAFVKGAPETVNQSVELSRIITNMKPLPAPRY